MFAQHVDILTDSAVGSRESLGTFAHVPVDAVDARASVVTVNEFKEYELVS